MIDVENLTKRYGSFTAVRDLTFRVNRGEVVGFLGPNGAGKSTTMRMLAGYMPPSCGRATVAGFDIFHQSLQAREQIGYLPENVPLYPEMRVSEYLKYRAALKGVRGRRIRDRLADVLELCRLGDVGRKLIGTLSKGYRQRVGLADAMIHEPELLILDEPTIGLDPNQIRQVREMITNLSRHHTIFISTHILSEVEMTCNRVIIIHRGQIAAVDSPQNLRRKLHQAGTIRIEGHFRDLGAAIQELERLEGIESLRSSDAGSGWQRIELVLAGDCEGDPRAEIFQLAGQRGWILRELTREAVSLEDVFSRLTHVEDSTSQPSHE